MNQSDKKLLLEIARARLQNRAGFYEKFQQELCIGAYLSAMAALYLDDSLSVLGGSIVPVELIQRRKQAQMQRLIDDWAARQPAPRPLKVEPLPPLPGVVEVVSVSPAAAPLRSLKQITPLYILKKSALVRELSDEWPTIAEDLQEASRNGLKDEAHAGPHGKWDVEKARAWAASRGKLLKKKENRLPVTPFTGLAR